MRSGKAPVISWYAVQSVIWRRSQLRSLPAFRSAQATLALPERRLVSLGAIAFLSVFAEASFNDWSALYRSGGVGRTPGAAAGGFSGYALIMFGCAFGDGVVHRLGRTRVVALGEPIHTRGHALTLAGGTKSPYRHYERIAGFPDQLLELGQGVERPTLRRLKPAIKVFRNGLAPPISWPTYHSQSRAERTGLTTSSIRSLISWFSPPLTSMAKQYRSGTPRRARTPITRDI